MGVFLGPRFELVLSLFPLISLKGPELEDVVPRVGGPSLLYGVHRPGIELHSR
jgi:hypothetical protein